MIDPKELEPPVPEEEIAAAAEQPAEETPVEPKSEVKEEKKEEKQTLVPHGALHEERQKRKAAEEEARRIHAASQQELARMNRRLEELFQAKQEAEKPPVPPYEVDPLGNLHAQVGDLNRQLAQSLQAQQSEAAARQQQQFVQSVQNRVMQEEARFAKENPDYFEATQFLKQRRAIELEAMGMGPQEILQAVAHDSITLALAAMQRGRSPAETAYEFAKARGYVKQEKKPDGGQKMEAMQKGLEASKGLSGGSAPGKPTIEQIAAMSEEEFAKYKAELKSKGQRISDVVQ